MSVSKVNSPPTMNTLISKINEIIDALNSGGGGSGDVSGKVDKIHTVSGSTGTIDNADYGPVLSFLDDTTFEGGSLSAFTGIISLSYMCNDYSSYNMAAKADGLHWSYIDSGFVEHSIIDADDSTIAIGGGQAIQPLQHQGERPVTEACHQSREGDLASRLHHAVEDVHEALAVSCRHGL